MGQTPLDEAGRSLFVTERSLMDTKQIIVMRHDLSMRKGKQIAQGSHASMAFLTRRIQKLLSMPQTRSDIISMLTLSDQEVAWIESSFAKVCCRVNSEEELLGRLHAAEELGLESHLITDSGRTEFHGEATNTCIAIGPDLPERIDPITGDLVLL